MEVKRRSLFPLSSTSKHFRRVLYGAIGLVLSSYVVLFILVVSKRIDRSAQEDVRRALVQEARKGPGLLGPDRWAAVARVLASDDGRLPRIRRKIVICSQPRFRRPPGLITALASFPGSGNTWIRFLVQQATGILTGSVYRDYSLKRNGFPAENVANGSVLLVKTHEWGQATRNRFQKAVLLIRDPYGALIAEFNRRAGGHVGHAAPEKFIKGNGWTNFVLSHSRLWMESILDWLQFTGPMLILRYENIISDLPGELIRLLKFLDANVSWAAFQCAIKNKEGIFLRAKKSIGFDPFNEAMRKVIDDYKSIVDKALQHYSQEIRVNLENLTLLQVKNESVASARTSAMPLTYVEKGHGDNPS